MSADGAPLVLVTGASGYVGGRLVPRLLEAGWRVRVLARDPSRLVGRAWLPRVEVARADVLDPSTLPAAMAGVRAALYLIHSMHGGPDFERRDLEAAAAFGRAAAEAGVERIVYLGGLGDESAGLSAHLRSRQACAAALRAGGVPVTELRAGVIVGSGSVSFELVRYLTERLPLMVCPRWVATRAQPIGIRDVLAYLLAALESTDARGRTIDLGGADVLTYGEMIQGYARARGLRRWLVPVPVLTPRLSSYWVHLVTPIPAGIARPLIDGLRSEVVVRDGGVARTLFPSIVPLGYAQAVRLALERLAAGAVETRWADALSASRGDVRPVMLEQREGLVLERREAASRAAPAALFAEVESLGGERGWPACNWAWRLRGALDRLVGGVGLRRGRRDPRRLRAGDALDFWRVEAVEEPRLLRLRAEMKVPGAAWLEFEVVPEPPGSRLVQTAIFAPRGLLGQAYWTLLYPLHAYIFRRMVERLAARAAAPSEESAT
jgi:uncharacterized protein YbjT (DUF2867 family)